MTTKTIQTAIAAMIIAATIATTWANQPHVYQCHTDTECELEERGVNQ